MRTVAASFHPSEDETFFWGWCALLIAGATFGKCAGAYFAARWAGLNHAEAKCAGIMMNTRALMELIILNVGYDLGVIPPNVREAINFYQTDGLLHGRQAITASDPKRTKILGNFASSYREKPVPLDGYPWFARTFMKSHIEIENDPAVWDAIEKLIGAQVL